MEAQFLYISKAIAHDTFYIEGIFLKKSNQYNLPLVFHLLKVMRLND